MPASRACEHVVNGRQFFEIERDRRRDILGLGPRRRHAHGDELADMAHLAGGEHRLLGGLEAGQAGHGADRLHAREVGRGEDGVLDDCGGT